MRKFSDLYEKYGLGAVKNFWLLRCLLPLARTVNLYKMKDYVGGVLENDETAPMSHYRRLTRFFEDWGGREDFLHDLMRQLLRFLKGMGFKTLVLDGTSWELGESKIHYAGAERFGKQGGGADLLGTVGQNRGIESSRTAGDV